ncbi:acyl-CoA N-acyltransferase [Phascolomyces articulosus]|uniref:Acyl-CoA N-acyltransferase n=1 Tax=Phascolomyces articulosus TaxID=60185 RepID=A0AAD5PEN0_9FUNG|nr:acyl-CoA N-acyltransferase [Phascolomyces articulosus]
MVQYTTYECREVTNEDLKRIDAIVTVVNQAYTESEGISICKENKFILIRGYIYIQILNIVLCTDGWTTPKHIYGEPRTNPKEIEDLIVRNGTTHAFYLALDGDLIVGTVLHEKPNDKGEAYISLLSVVPNYQSKGVGGQLFRFLLNDMKKKGIPTASLSTFASRLEVLSWYKKLGFVEEPERVDFGWHYRDSEIKPDCDAELIIMKKPLV